MQCLFFSYFNYSIIILSSADLEILKLWEAEVGLNQACTTFSLLPAALRLLLWITAASDFKLFLFYGLLLFFFDTLSLACFHTSAWPSFYYKVPWSSRWKVLLIHGRHNVFFPTTFSCILAPPWPRALRQRLILAMLWACGNGMQREKIPAM